MRDLRSGAQTGDAGFEGKPAVILGIQKQPTADTIHLTRSIETALEEMKISLPAGMDAPEVTFRQATSSRHRSARSRVS
ncbi:efflux RND transporter permease subunit [Thauera humireducens]|uniref:efflux RND transporter permease subunit n=1 Tax=Thauera humireducens TaxID=1134435 RepID=UPI00311FA510